VITGPIAGGFGKRDIITGPGFWNEDLALLENFKMPWSDSHRLQFRTDAINGFNHPNFNNPSALLINPDTFGNITSTVNRARPWQLGLRYIF
jgi:hypothetical protein